MNSLFVPGQRWLSTAEPELGLGTVMRLIGRSVQIVFTGSGVVRQYAMDTAPLTRAEFRVGEKLRADGVDHVVESVTLQDGLYLYGVAGKTLHEGVLDAEQPVSQADARLLGGRVDRNPQFELRAIRSLNCAAKCCGDALKRSDIRAGVCWARGST